MTPTSVTLPAATVREAVARGGSGGVRCFTRAAGAFVAGASLPLTVAIVTIEGSLATYAVRHDDLDDPDARTVEAFLVQAERAITWRGVAPSTFGGQP